MTDSLPESGRGKRLPFEVMFRARQFPHIRMQTHGPERPDVCANPHAKVSILDADDDLAAHTSLFGEILLAPLSIDACSGDVGPKSRDRLRDRRRGRFWT